MAARTPADAIVGSIAVARKVTAVSSGFAIALDGVGMLSSERGSSGGSAAMNGSSMGSL